jgi:chromosome segregation ATPase
MARAYAQPAQYINLTSKGIFMISKATPPNTNANDTTYSTRIAQLEKQKSKLRDQMEPLMARSKELEREIVARDWILTGHRPRGCSETFKHATEMRERLYAERKTLAGQIGELQNTLTPLNQQLAELKCELTYHQNSEITPATVKDEIDKVHAAVGNLRTGRKSLAIALSKAKQRLNEIDDAEAAQLRATDLLTKARSKAFLATATESTVQDREVADAEKNMNRCREKSLNAVAARPAVLSQIEKTDQELGALDEEINQLEAHLEDERKRLKKLNAMNDWAEFLMRGRVVIRNMLEADRTIGRALIESLAHEGLKEFDYRGRMVRPAWLSTKADIINNI